MAEQTHTAVKNNTLLVAGIVALVVGGLAFFGGMQYQKSQRVSFGDGQFMMRTGGQNGQARQGRLQGSRPVSGEILSTDDTSITVKLMDGSSKIVILSDKTAINKAETGTKSDLKTGEKISAFGTANADGSITAQNISIGGNMFRMQRPGTGQQTDSK